ncbi:MAG TPA: hypothetical protein VFY54_17935, partial [Rubrobacter sp.]|nr:hypothetical protein [Rubrobacter sp.]
MSTSTAIELGRDGSRTVFHRRGERAWTHPEGTPTMHDFDRRLSCPLCIPVEDRRVVSIDASRPRKSECDYGHGPGEWGLKKSGYGYCRRRYRDATNARRMTANKPADAPVEAGHHDGRLYRLRRGFLKGSTGHLERPPWPVRGHRALHTPSNVSRCRRLGIARGPPVTDARPPIAPTPATKSSRRRISSPSCRTTSRGTPALPVPGCRTQSSTPKVG